MDALVKKDGHGNLFSKYFKSIDEKLKENMIKQTNISGLDALARVILP